jgi:hypothetical protein
MNLKSVGATRGRQSWKFDDAGCTLYRETGQSLGVVSVSSKVYPTLRALSPRLPPAEHKALALQASENGMDIFEYRDQFVGDYA